MIFSSIFFIFVFLPVTLILYYLVPERFKNCILLLLSLVFYAWGEPVYVFLMMFSIVFNYFGGLQIDEFRKQNEPSRQKISFIITIVVNIAVLGFFKYYGFLLENLNAVLPFDIPYRELSLPIGISFYTFQILSYIIDVYRDRVPVQHNFITFGTYVTMFPQLIAGPIVRYADIEKQLKHRALSFRKFGQGVTWFILGLGKKVLLANKIGAAYDAIAALPAGERSFLTAWIGCLAFTMQIYFDFSGYSDMAIGLGKMLGFDFLKNFDYPYTSKNITQFWRKWHISLGTWFREYVYIPLGGNRCSVPENIRNLLVVWFLTGLWHGASWNFIVWGLYYGCIIVLERYVLAPLLEKLPQFVQWLYSFFLVMLGWVWFFSDTLGEALSYFSCMFGFGACAFVDATGLYYLQNYLLLFLLCAVCCGPWLMNRFHRFTLQKQGWRQVAAVVVYAVILLLCIASLVNDTYNPFLYFRF